MSTGAGFRKEKFMILEKIKDLLGMGKTKKPLVEMLISVEKIEKRLAVLENGRLEEYQIERQRDMVMAGSIFKGRVKNIEPGLKAMFVDIGAERNAFLHYWDAIPAAMDEIETFDRKGKGGKKKRITVADIPNLYPVGSEVIVQVAKGPIGTKGARVTTNLSLPGRFLVITPFSDQFGISRKISDSKERSRLRKILEKLNVPDNIGVIIRTAGEDKRHRFFVRDLAYLVEQWQEISEKMQTASAPAILHEEMGLTERAVRDFLTDEVDRIVIDDEDAYERVKKLVGLVSKRSEKKVKLFQDAVPLFEKFGVDKQFETSFQRQIHLKSGSSIVIDETEALVAIDVNTGKTKIGGDKEETLLATNLEAAEEVARQLRLRNVGGIIIIDFIDMKSRKDQNAVYMRLRDALSRDKAKTHVLPISQLGLVEMTRQRTEESVLQTTFMKCPHCSGRGMVKTPETLSLEIQRHIGKIMRKHPDLHELRVSVHPSILDRLRKEDEEALIALERKYQGKLAFRPDAKLLQEQYIISNAITDEEVKL